MDKLSGSWTFKINSAIYKSVTHIRHIAVFDMEDGVVHSLKKEGGVEEYPKPENTFPVL